jgi:hypothetical protein
LIVSEKPNQPKRNGALSEIPAFPVLSNLYVIKGGHKVGSNLCSFLFGYCIGRILLTGLKDVFQSAAIFRCASVSKQFDRQRRKEQQDGD